VLSEIKEWNTKYLRKLEKPYKALTVNLLDNSETTQTKKIHHLSGKPKYKNEMIYK
jgi:hypothetical protein